MVCSFSGVFAERAGCHQPDITIQMIDIAMFSADDFVIDVLRVYLCRRAKTPLKDLWPGQKFRM